MGKIEEDTFIGVYFVYENNGNWYVEGVKYNSFGKAVAAARKLQRKYRQKEVFVENHPDIMMVGDDLYECWCYCYKGLQNPSEIAYPNYKEAIEAAFELVRHEYDALQELKKIVKRGYFNPHAIISIQYVTAEYLNATFKHTWED